MCHNLLLFYNVILYVIDFLPASMTYNIGMLNDFFSSKNDDENDFLLNDYNNNSIISDKMKNTFEQFGKNFYFKIMIKSF